MGKHLAIGFVVLCLACDPSESLDAGSDGGGLDGSGDVGTLDAGRIDDVLAFCAGYHERLCRWNATCRSVGDTTCNFPLVDDLDAACDAIEANLAAGIVAYDPGAAAACLALPYDRCDLVRPFDAEACRAAIHGNVPVGGACYSTRGRSFNQECVPDAQCLLDGCLGECVALGGVGADCTTIRCGATLHCAGGRCAERPGAGEACPDSVCDATSVCIEGTCIVPATEGAACTDDVAGRCAFPLACVGGVCARTSGPDEMCRVPDACPDDYVCANVAGVSHCRALLDDGMACDESNPLCRSGSYCANVGSDETPDFRCGTYRDEGEDCGSYDCTHPLWCRGGGPGDAAEGTCRPPGGEGDICTSTVERGGGNRCEDGLRCREDGMCRALAPVGGSCAVHSDCASELWCRVDTCAEPGALGAACLEGVHLSCVVGTYCADTSTCVAARADGQPCTEARECASNTCDGTTCITPVAPCTRP